jgi:hypothetical protein
METCKEHSGICATINAIEKELTQFREDTTKNFTTVNDNVKSVREGFDGFKTWLLYSVLGCGLTIVTSIILMIVKLK